MRALIVGAGKMGAHHARIARSLGLDVETVDPYQSADHLSIEDAGRADVAVIATPIAALATSACAALRTGCTRLLVEKPLAATLAQAELVVAAAEAAGATLLVGYTERFNPLVQELGRDPLARIGALRALHFERAGPAPAGERLGPQLDLAVHDFDLMRCFGLEPVLVEGCCTADSAEAVLVCGTAVATVRARYTPFERIRRFTIRGSRGTIDCDLAAQRAAARGENGVQRLDGAPVEPLLLQWRALLAGEGPSGEDGLAALRLAAELERLSASAPAADPRAPRPLPGPVRP